MSFLSVLVGRPLSSNEQDGQKIGVAAGVPAMGLDGLSSSAYGPEAALAILAPLGAAGLHWITPVMGAVLVLLALLYFSYRQTIAAYPANGGSYTVAKENLGMQAGLTAGAALMLDYVLNVAVGISAGVAALTSAAPKLHPYTVPLCLGVLAVITLLNLRGTGEAGLAFSIPTYLFLATMAVVLTVGLAKMVHAGGRPTPVDAPPPLPTATTAGAVWWLLLRTFASGCTAMTGVEAVSNGVAAFKDPAVKTARRTLTVIVVALAMLLAGVAVLAHAYGIGAMDQTKGTYQSVLSQLTAAVIGRGWLYYLTIAGVLATLCLSANTSFVGFPRLCRLIADDEYLPHGFAVLGRRLVFSVGIGFLATAAAGLLVLFDGITDRLIPLFAVGAFLAFTLSQAGMVFHWRRQEEAGRWHAVHVAVNGTGAVATAVALAIILAAKFAQGAWITVLALPALLVLFNVVHGYYRRVRRNRAGHEPLDFAHATAMVAVLPMREVNRLADRGIQFALRMSCEVIAVHLSNVGGTEGEKEADHLKRDWARRVEGPARAANVHPPELRIIYSPYRLFLDPLLDELRKIGDGHPGRQLAVIVPQLIKTHWWQVLLHDRRGERLKHALLERGGTNAVVINVPWHLDEASRVGR